MLVAYLRGLLWKNHKYGGRSLASEEVILEALSAELLAENIETGTAADLALIPVMTEKGIRQTAEHSNARLKRAAELRLLDIYKVADQISGKMKLANPKNELSLYQLYQIAQKTGIFEALDRHNKDKVSKHLL